jgi:predicted nuclease of restriction endonuclease-like RecB superfamily
MLTNAHAIVAYDRGRAVPDRLTRKAHAHYVGYAAKMLAVYRSGAGRPRGDLHRSVEGIFADEADCPPRRIQAFCKLLDDAGVFATDPQGRAAALRLSVFGRAAAFHPLVREPDRLFESGEEAVKARIAKDLGRPWAEIEADLYADVIGAQRLLRFEGYPSPEALLSRYNVAQLQACLYRAERMSVTATGDFKTILRYAKLARLLHDIRRLGPSLYRMDLSGPASALGETRRYGVAMARFVPALLACRGWEMRAQLSAPWGGKARLELSWMDGLTSHLPAPEEFDSAVEEAFAKKFGAEREGWRLFREAEIVHEGQTAFVPDFVFRHADGAEVLFEIVGYWTPEYLAAKRETYRTFRGRRILMAVPARSLREDAAIPEDVLVYKSAIKIGPVLEALERMRGGWEGGLTK